jgi:hypothetical protein
MGRQAKERARRARLNKRVRHAEIWDAAGVGNIWDTKTKGTDHGESNRERSTPGPRT